MPSPSAVNTECCFDYGNAENDCTNRSEYVDGAMESVYFGTGYGGGGRGPWIGADLENGIYGGPYVDDPALRRPFVMAMVKGGQAGFATKGADATAGALRTYFDGPRPGRYQPMRKTGAIVLGMGGDNVRDNVRAPVRAPDIPALSIGTFYEGVLTRGYSTDDADAAVHANIKAAGYGR